MPLPRRSCGLLQPRSGIAPRQLTRPFCNPYSQPWHSMATVPAGVHAAASNSTAGDKPSSRHSRNKHNHGTQRSAPKQPGTRESQGAGQSGEVSDTGHAPSSHHQTAHTLHGPAPAKHTGQSQKQVSHTASGTASPSSLPPSRHRRARSAPGRVDHSSSADAQYAFGHSKHAAKTSSKFTVGQETPPLLHKSKSRQQAGSGGGTDSVAEAFTDKADNDTSPAQLVGARKQQSNVRLSPSSDFLSEVEEEEEEGDSSSINDRQLTGKIKRAKSVGELKYVISTYKDTAIFNYIHVVAAIMQVKRLKQPIIRDLAADRVTIAPAERGILQRLMAMLLQPDMLHHCTVRELSNVLYVLGTLGLSEPGWLNPLVAPLAANGWQSVVQSGKPQDFSSTIWALAKLGYGDASFWDEAATTAIKALPQQSADRNSRPTSQDWANTLYAFAFRLHYSKPLCEHVEEAILMGCLDTANDQSIANIMWAFAKVNHELQPGVVTWCEDWLARNQLTGASPQTVSSLVWAFAALRCRLSAACLQRVVQQATSGCFTWYPQASPMLHWGLSAVDVVPSSSPTSAEDVTQANWSLTWCKYASHQLLKTNRMQHATSQDWSALLYGFARFRYQDTHLSVLCVEGLCKSGVSASRTFSNALYAIAVLDDQQAALKLLDTVSAREGCLDRMMPTLHEQGLCNVLWALTVLGLRQQYLDLCNKLVDQANSLFAEGSQLGQDGAQWASEGLGQLAQTHQDMCTQPVAGQHWLSSQLVSKAKQVWGIQQNQANKPSYYQTMVADELRQMLRDGEAGLAAVDTEVPIPLEPTDLLLSVHLLVHLSDGKKVVVEVHGPSRHMINKPTVKVGGLALRNRMIAGALSQSKGWHLLDLHWQDAYEAKQTGQLRDRLRALLANI